MNFFGFEKKQEKVVQVPVLVRFWHEDEVWNGTALDIPVAVFGHTFEEARTNFGEALQSHFEALLEHKQLDVVVENLLVRAKEHGYYERIQPTEVFEKLLVAPPLMEGCYAHA